MDRLQQKRHARKLLVQSKRKDKLISGYIKSKHPEIYAEAIECYETLNALYPKKRDLCKTVEYLRMTTGAVNYNQYYYHRKVEKNQLEKAVETTPEMELRIPLLTHETLQAQATLDIPGAADVITEVNQDQALRAVFNEMTTTETTQTTTTHEAVSDSVQLEDQTYQGLVDELVNDPFLQDAFQDIEFNDPTPLEIELNNMLM